MFIFLLCAAKSETALLEISTLGTMNSLAHYNYPLIEALLLCAIIQTCVTALLEYHIRQQLYYYSIHKMAVCLTKEVATHLGSRIRFIMKVKFISF